MTEKTQRHRFTAEYERRIFLAEAHKSKKPGELGGDDLPILAIWRGLGAQAPTDIKLVTTSAVRREDRRDEG